MASICYIHIRGKKACFKETVRWKIENWVIVKTKKDYQLLASSRFGVLVTETWTVYSSIIGYELVGSYWYFYTSGDALYKCPVDGYGMHKNTKIVWQRLLEDTKGNVEIIEDKAWLAKNWNWRF